MHVLSNSLQKANANVVGNYRATIEPLVCVTEFASNSSMQEEDEDEANNLSATPAAEKPAASAATLNNNNSSSGDIRFRFDGVAIATVGAKPATETLCKPSAIAAPAGAVAPAMLAVSKLSPVQLNLTPVSPTDSASKSPGDLSPNPHRLPSPLLNPPSASCSAAASPVSVGSSASIALPVTPASTGSERQRRKIERNTSAPLPGMLTVG